MSDASTQKMLEMYLEDASAPRFLAGMFRTPPQNFHNSEKVEMDVIRSDADIAVPLPSVKAGGREVEASKYTNKAYDPIPIEQIGTVSAIDSLKRRAGVNPFADPDFLAYATEQTFMIARKMEDQIRRTEELACSQVLQTGAISLVDSAGAVVFAEDFKPKATHMVTVGAAWAADGSTGDPLGDVESVCQAIRRDSGHQPKELIFGTTAFTRFLANAKVKERLDQQGYKVGEVAPVARGDGGTFMGYVWVGYYRLEMWMYDGFYKHPQSGTDTPYITDDYVVVKANARLDLTYGGIPLIAPPDSRVLGFLPPRISDSGRGLDLTVNAWITPDNKHLKVSVGTRVLPIPTAIDSFARLDVIP